MGWTVLLCFGKSESSVHYMILHVLQPEISTSSVYIQTQRVGSDTETSVQISHFESQRNTDNLCSVMNDCHVHMLLYTTLLLSGTSVQRISFTENMCKHGWMNRGVDVAELGKMFLGWIIGHNLALSSGTTGLSSDKNGPTPRKLSY